MKTIRCPRLAALLPCPALLAVPLLAATASAQNSFSWLFGDTTGRATLAQGLSADGHTVVGYSTPVGSSAVASAWTSAGVLSVLGIPAGFLVSNAFGVSADGSVIAGNASANAGATGVWRWTAATGMVLLAPPVENGGIGGYALSSNGRVIVGRTSYGYGIAATAWRDGAPELLAPFPPGSFIGGTYAFAVNATGTAAAGWTVGQNGYNHGFVWSQNTGATIIPLAGTAPRFAAVSPDGSHFFGSTTEGGARFLEWSAQGGLVVHDLLPGLYSLQITAFTPNCSVIVGYGQATSGANVPMVWTADTGWLTLDHLLSLRGISLPAGTSLTDIRGISADGHTLAGNGTGTGMGQHAWIMWLDSPIIPAPSSAAALLGAALLALGRRRRSC